MPWVDEELCGGCDACVDQCEAGAISLNDDDIAVIDKALCKGDDDCGECIEACPTEAIQAGEKPKD